MPNYEITNHKITNNQKLKRKQKTGRKKGNENEEKLI